VNPDPMPRWIWSPFDINNNLDNKANSQLFCVYNSGNGTVIDKNGINIMGIEFQGEANGQWNNLRPHPYMNQEGRIYSIVKLNQWYNLYFDNNNLHDHYGTGLRILQDDGNPLYQLQNHEIEVNNNIIRNVYGFNPAPPAPYIGYDDGGDGIGIFGVRGAIIENNIVYNNMDVTGMCGRLGIGGESFKDCFIQKNMINGYNRTIHIESDYGNNLIKKNRCTGTFCNILLNSSNGDVNPNVITQNYFSNENIPLDNVLWPWNGVPNSQPLSYATNWSYDEGMLYLLMEAGTKYIGTAITLNEFFIDVTSGTATKDLQRRFIHFNGDGDSFDMGLRINCNFFHHNHDNTPIYNKYGFLLCPEEYAANTFRDIINEFYGNTIIDAGSSYNNPSTPFKTDINYFHDNVVTGGNFSTDYLLNLFPNFTQANPDAFCCTIENGDPTKRVYLENPLASTLPFTEYNNTTFYIKGIFEIDADMTFNNCSFYFTINSAIQMHDGYTLDLNGSNLKASCEWWNGIFANDISQKIIIQNGNTIQNALFGVHLTDGAILEATNSYFRNNGSNHIYLSNMTQNPYPGFIKHNTFTTQANLPGNVWNRTNTAIELHDVRQLNIGEITDLNSGNIFDGMFTGIYISNVLNTSNSNIGIYNNTFSNIQAESNDDYSKMINCYSDAKGAAIFCKADANASSICHVDVQNTINNLTNPYFSNCDKAIVSLGNKLDAKYLRIFNGLLGIMCQSIYNRDYSIEQNAIYNVHMGIHLSGNQRNVSIGSNTINAFRTINEYDNNLQIITTYVPIGIKYQTNTSWIGGNVNQSVFDNSITINRIAGVGIFNSNVGSVFEEKGNTVLFNTNSTAPINNYNISSLMGYYNENNYKARYIQNTTVGPGGNEQVWLARTSISMFMNESRMCKLDCNRLKYTRFGFFVWGNNTTTETSITHNKCNANAIPWFFLDNANKGTFGNVGNATDPDNGNEFISIANPIDWRSSIPAINTTYKVFRLSSGIFPEKIYTSNSLLDFSESGPLGSGWEYLYQPSFQGFTDPCDEDDEYEPEYFAEPDVDSNEYISAMAVAQDSMAYINFPTVGSWIDKYKLYMELDADSLLLNSRPELLYFYNTTATQTIGDIKYASEKIALLYDSTTNASNDSLRYASAVTSNTLISSANNWEMNEKTVNDVMLFMYNNPIDSIPLYMKDDMQFLASSCPFVEGTAVYRARTIYSLWEPNAIFDDRIICIQGQNKNQDNSKINIDSLIESQIAEANVKMVSNNISANTRNSKKIISESKSVINIFPNPASTFIIIEYNCESDGELILYNSLGQEILKTSLEKGNKKVQLQINDIANGIYQYKCKFENCIEQIGKLTIQK
jgi:hypothetical protein